MNEISKNNEVNKEYKINKKTNNNEMKGDKSNQKALIDDRENDPK